MHIELLQEFEFIKQVYINNYYSLLLAKQPNSDNRVLLKIPAADSTEPPIDFKHIFKQEQAIFNILASESVVVPCRLIENESYNIICYEIGTKKMLSEILISQNDKILTSIFYLNSINKALFKVHNNDVCHFNLTPYNILVDEDTENVAFINFTPYDSENLSDYKYISPELTNRVQREQTLLTDFYSLGVIFYEILFKHPIDHTSIKSLRRAHLTMSFPPLHKQDTNIPTHLSRVINRLLHKLPSMRYKNSFSLEYDLQLIQDAYKNNVDSQITLGKYNHISEIHFPVITSHFNKSVISLLDEIHKEASKQILIYTISGGIEQGLDLYLNTFHQQCKNNVYLSFSTNIEPVSKKMPFHIISILLKKLVYYVKFSRDVHTKELLKEFLENANPRILSTLYHLCPDFNIIQKNPKVQESIDVLNDHRTIYVAIKNFIDFITTINQPLILNFSHIEYADTDSLKIFISLCNDDVKNIVFVLSDYHFHRRISHIGKTSVSNVQIPILTDEYVNRYIADILQETQENTQTITRAALHNQETNIFLITRSLNTAIKNKSLYFNSNIRRWELNETKFYATTLDTDFKSYILEFYNNLSSTQQTILRYAAIMGMMFECKTISHITGFSVATITTELWSVQSQGVIKPITQFSKLKNSENLSIYAFCNQTILKSFFDLTTQEEQNTKKDILASLLDICQSEPYHFILFEEFLFNNAILVKDLEEKHIYILLSFYCSKAKNYLSLRKIHEAERNINICFSLLKPIAWLDRYYLTKEVYFVGMSLTYQTNNSFFEQLAIDSAKYLLTPEDKLVFNTLRIKYHIDNKQFANAAMVINQSLSIIKITLPLKETLVQRVRGGLQNLLFKNKLFNNELLQSSEPATAYEKELCLLNISAQKTDEYIYRKTFELIRSKTISTGIKEEFCIPLLQYSIQQISNNQLKYGLKIAATTVATKHENKAIDIDKKLLYYTQIHPYVGKLDNSSDFFRGAIDYFVDYGNYQKAIYTCFHHIVQTLLSGANLSKAWHEIDEQMQKLTHHTRSNSYYRLLHAFKDMCEYFIKYDKNIHTHPLKNYQFSKPDAQYWNNVALTLFHYYNNSFTQAHKHGKAALHLSQYANNNFSIEILKLYIAYTELELAIRDKTFIADDKLIQQSQHKLEELSKFAPDIYLPKLHLLYGLQYRLNGNEKLMVQSFKKAVSLSSIYSYKSIEAIANRYLSEYYKSNKMHEEADMHLIRAYNNYKIWGNNAFAQKIKLENLSAFEEMEIRIYQIS